MKSSIAKRIATSRKAARTRKRMKQSRQSNEPLPWEPDRIDIEAIKRRMKFPGPLNGARTS